MEIQTRRVVVVGGGVLGSSVTLRLAQDGYRVTLLEADRLAAGTSSCSFAWLNSNAKTPRAYHDLNAAGLSAHLSLKHEFPATPWLHEGGSLEIVGPPGAQTLRDKVRQLQDWSYPAELISASRLAELEPDIALDAIPDATIAFFPQEAWIDPALFIAHMTLKARELGATIRCGVRVTDLVVEGGRACGVITAAGERLDADLIVNCAGRWTNDVVADANLRIPMAPRLGFLAFTPPGATTLSRVLRTTLVDMRPDGAGRLVLHDNDVDERVNPDTPLPPMMQHAEAMTNAAARLLPMLSGIVPEAVRRAIRPVPQDGYSAIGPIPGLGNYYLAVTHSAVTLSAHLARLIAWEIAGKDQAALEQFRPARFFGGNRGPIGEGEALHNAG
jgi:glycine/D-amino acid oxidase-like deaminating enzyme